MTRKNGKPSGVTMETSLAKPNAALSLLEDQSKRTMTKVLLAKLAIRRQAAISEDTYLVYSEDLSPYDIQDIAKALDMIGKKPRMEFETSFPEVGLILAEVKRVAKQRKIGALYA
jgi:hypothetical protein